MSDASAVSVSREVGGHFCQLDRSALVPGSTLGMSGYDIFVPFCVSASFVPRASLSTTIGASVEGMLA